jgi:hypothetical protein
VSLSLYPNERSASRQLFSHRRGAFFLCFALRSTFLPFGIFPFRRALDTTIGSRYLAPVLTMPNVIYTLNDAIDTFFSEAGASSSKVECDNFVRQKYEGRILPVNI